MIVEAGAVIGPGVAIGAGTVIAPNAVIGPSCQIGRDCYIGPGASIQYALIGNRVIIHRRRPGSARTDLVSSPAPRGPERMPQIGRVVIQDDVEIGANTTVDRGAMADTVIGEGTKIDNLVQIAHNVRIGRDCMIAGQVGISGSVTLGDGVMHRRRRRHRRSFDDRQRRAACRRVGPDARHSGGRALGGLSGRADATRRSAQIAALRRLAGTRKSKEGKHGG